MLPLVAGLFVLVEGLNNVGALSDLARVLEACTALPRIPASLISSFGIATLSNVMNNLPSGLLAGGAPRHCKKGGGSCTSVSKFSISIGIGG
jgi:arsenical pump membrane protein